MHPKDNYNSWFKDRKDVILSLENGKHVCKLTYSRFNSFTADTIRTRFKDALKDEGIEMIITEPYNEETTQDEGQDRNKTFSFKDIYHRYILKPLGQE